MIAGAQRCGTTFLYHLLDRHPEIQMAKPVRPEPKYFLGEEAANGSLADYRSACFSPLRACRMRGEKATSYLERPEVAARVRAVIPEAKLLFLLRDPVDRAISNYWFSVQHGIEHLPIAEAFGESEERRPYSRERFSVSPFAYIRRGRYAEDLESYRRLFPDANLKLVSFERLVANVDRELASILDFLGLPPAAAAAVDRLDRNEAPRRHEIDAALRRSLAKRFVESNRALVQNFGFDVGAWPSAR